MDEFQRRFSEVIAQREPELLEDLPRLKGVLADYLPHPAYRRAILITLECGLVQSIHEATPERLPVLRSQFLKRLDTQGVKRDDATWAIDTLLVVVGMLRRPELQTAIEIVTESTIATPGDSDFDYILPSPSTQQKQAERIQKAKLDRLSSPEKYVESDEKSDVQNLVIRILKELTFLSDGELANFTTFIQTCGSILAIDYLDETLDFLLRTVDIAPLALSDETLIKIEEFCAAISELKAKAKSPATLLHLDRLGSSLHNPTDDSTAYDPDADDDDEAGHSEFDLLLLQAQSGDRTAQVNLGITFENAEHPGGRVSKDGEEIVNRDYSQAIFWYRIAAEQGDADGQFNLGDMYEYGKGVEQNFTKAAEWYRKAADQSSASAQFALGSMYAEGNGLEVDHEKALNWFQKAVAQSDDIEALKASANEFYDNSIKEQLAREAYLMRAANLGDKEAQAQLGLHYEEWPWGSRFEDAVKYYLLAAAQGSEDAYRALAKLHFHGFGVQEDGSEALRYLALAGEPKTDADRTYVSRSKTLAAAEAGDPIAMHTMGMWYTYGDHNDNADGWYEYNIEKEITRARSWIERSAEAGFAVAAERLRQMDSPQNVDGHYVDAKYGKHLYDGGDIIGGGSVLWFEKMQGDFESQDLLTALEDSLVGDKHEPYELISGIIQRIHEISIVQAAADDEWEYESGKYLIAYTEYLNSDGASSAAESVFRKLRSSYGDRFFLVLQPDQTWVVVHRPPRSVASETAGDDSIREMCDRLLKENVGWDEETGRYGDEEYLFCEALDKILKDFLQTGGDLRVSWKARVTADTPEAAVEEALKDLSDHRERHQFETQYRGFREAIIPATTFTLE